MAKEEREMVENSGPVWYFFPLWGILSELQASPVKLLLCPSGIQDCFIVVISINVRVFFLFSLTTICWLLFLSKIDKMIVKEKKKERGNHSGTPYFSCYVPRLLKRLSKEKSYNWNDWYDLHYTLSISLNFFFYLLI